MTTESSIRQPGIFIYGRCGGRLRKVITMAAGFYMSVLLPRHIHETLTLNISMKTPRAMKGNEGTCMIVDTNRRNRAVEFDIDLNRDTNTKTTLYNLAHELVHVKQFVMGELNEEQTKFRGGRFDTDVVDYWDLPWEIEAFGRERGLYIRFVEKFKLDKIDSEELRV
jgi:hypothetical protein